MTQHESASNWYTISEVAEYYAVHRNTVRGWIKTGRLKAHRLNRIVRIAADDLAAFEAVALAPVGSQGHRLKRRFTTNASPAAARHK